MKKILTGLAACVTMMACVPADFAETRTLPRGEQISIRTLVAENRGKVACINHDKATNSCASLSTSYISGNWLIAKEVAAAKGLLGGAPQRVEIVTKNSIEGPRACVDAKNISLGTKYRDTGYGSFVLEFTRELISSMGGVCATYYRNGSGYIISSRGRNGAVLPPGDVRIDYIDGPVKLRGL